MALLCLHRLVANDDSGLERLVAREGEGVRGVETVGSRALKSERAARAEMPVSSVAAGHCAHA